MTCRDRLCARACARNSAQEWPHLSYDSVNFVGRHELVLPQPRPAHSVLVHHGALVGAGCSLLMDVSVRLSLVFCVLHVLQTELHVEGEPLTHSHIIPANLSIRTAVRLHAPLHSRNASRCTLLRDRVVTHHPLQHDKWG